MRFSVLCFLLTLLMFPADAHAGSPRSASEYFDAGHLQEARISPEGHLVAMRLIENDQDVIRLVNLDEEVGVDVFTGLSGYPGRIIDLNWIDGNQIVFQVSDYSRHRVFAVRWRGVDNGQPVVEGEELNLPGRMLNPLPEENDQFLWAAADLFRENQSAVYRVDLAEGAPLRTRDSMVVQGLDQVLYWVSDHNGAVLLAVTMGDDATRQFWQRDDEHSDWQQFMTVEDSNAVVRLIGYANERGKILALSNLDTDTVALTSIDVSTGATEDVLYKVPGRDIEDVAIDWQSGDVQAVSYVQDGLPQHDYFDDASSQERDLLAEKFPGLTVSVISRDREDDYQILYVHGEKDPGSFWYYNVGKRELEWIGERLPNLEKDSLAVSWTGEVRSEDGLLIQYILTPPVDMEPPYPMVVMPHGGPIGVADNIAFKPSVQFLSNHGYAVLRVNFRGSAGFGREFRDAGLQEVATGIEMDIQASVEELLSQGIVDPERLCIYGSSYGGFSAMVNAIENPDRFQCAASHVGVYDIPLIFSASDSTQTRLGREHLSEIWGDFDKDFESMVSQSPLYRIGELEVPVRITHNRGDQRVSVDQAYRLKMGLDHYGKDYEWEIYEAAGHGFQSVEAAAEHFEKLVDFLNRHLKGASQD